MELVVNQELECAPEPIEVKQLLNHGLLNSNYQSVVKQSYNTSARESVFGIRQRLKSLQFSTIDHTAVILKLSVFAIILLVIF